MVQTLEEWRVVPFRTMYEVSSLGNVRRIKDTYESTFRGKPITRKIKVNVVGSKLSAKGYARVNLSGVVFQVHRLIALVFIDNIDNKEQVNHINGIKTDNRVENLEWVTNMENRHHACANNLIARGEVVGSSKLLESDVIEIRRLYDSKTLHQWEIAEMFNLCQQSVSSICTRKTWKHI